jgi:hypothetical protein
LIELVPSIGRRISAHSISLPSCRTEKNKTTLTRNVVVVVIFSARATVDACHSSHSNNNAMDANGCTHDNNNNVEANKKRSKNSYSYIITSKGMHLFKSAATSTESTVQIKYP